MQLSRYMALASKHKLPLMGINIFLIVISHCGVILTGPAAYIKLGVYPVDVFFFLSGMGAHFSLSKNDDCAQFLKRRFVRIYIPYFPIIILYFLLIGAQLAAKYGWVRMLGMLWGNLSMLGWICSMDAQLNWYPQAVALVYLITPVMFALVRRLGAQPKKLLYLLLFVIASQPCFFGTPWLIASSRLIPFTLGMIACELVKRGVDFRLNVPLILIFCVAGHFLTYLAMGASEEMIWKYGLEWLPGALSVSGNILVLCWVFEFLEKCRPLRFIQSLNTLLGRYSYEILLVHILFFMLVAKLGIAAMDVPGIWNVLLWLAASAAAVFLGVIYGKGTEKIRMKFL